MNWGKGIIIGMSCFIIFVVTLVVLLMRQKTDLVSEDYYQRELAYDQQYNAQQNYLDAQAEIHLNTVKDTLIIFFPEQFQQANVLVNLKRPNNKEQDIQLSLKTQARIAIPTKKMPKGIFDCFINGDYQHKPYEFTTQITVE